MENLVGKTGSGKNQTLISVPISVLFCNVCKWRDNVVIISDVELVTAAADKIGQLSSRVQKTASIVISQWPRQEAQQLVGPSETHANQL